MIRLLTFAALLLCPIASLSAAEGSADDLAARTELHAVHTLTLSDGQFLSGDLNGKETITSGQLRIAQGVGRLPVVVLQHGSGGIGANIEMWSKNRSKNLLSRMNRL